jgi:hypothetical protein
VPRKLSEHDVQSQILDHLATIGMFAWRNNKGAFKKGKHFVRFGGKDGAPDIMAIQPTVDPAYGCEFYGIEVKAVGKKQSDAQRQWQADCEKAGGCYILAYSLEDVIAGLK